MLGLHAHPFERWCDQSEVAPLEAVSMAVTQALPVAIRLGRSPESSNVRSFVLSWPCINL